MRTSKFCDPRGWRQVILRLSLTVVTALPLNLSGCNQLEPATPLPDSTAQVDDQNPVDRATPSMDGGSSSVDATLAILDVSIEVDALAIEAKMPDVGQMDASTTDAQTPSARGADSSAVSCEASTCASCDATQRCEAPGPAPMCAGGNIDLSHRCREGMARSFSHADVIAQSFTPSEDVRVLRIGVQAGQGACHYYQSLHLDANGEPGRILNWVNYRPMQVDSDNLDVPTSALDRHTKLTAGVRYWLVLRLGGMQPCSFLVADVAADLSYRIGRSTDIFAPDNMVPGETVAGPGGRIAQFVEVAEERLAW